MRPETFLYFAYGSNMSGRRLRAPDRAPSAVFIETARLAGWRLVFDKIGMDGSAKADCERSNSGAGEEVHGALFRIDAGDRAALDRAEGLGHGYDAFELEVTAGAGRREKALTYLATRKDARLRPFDWYLQHVLIGARECGLPADYVAAIARVEAIRDPDAGRRARELARHAAG